MPAGGKPTPSLPLSPYVFHSSEPMSSAGVQSLSGPMQSVLADLHRVSLGYRGGRTLDARGLIEDVRVRN